MIEKELRYRRLAGEIEAASLKARSGGPIDEPEDYALPHWAGILPLRLTHGEPRPDTGVSGLPGYLRAAVTGVTG